MAKQSNQKPQIHRNEKEYKRYLSGGGECSLVASVSLPSSGQAGIPRQVTRFRHDAVAHALKQCTPEVLSGLFPITEQQARVLRCFLEDPNDARIARLLNLSAKTVSAHLDNIRKRLGVRCRLELMQHALVKILADGDDEPGLGKSPKENDENDD